MVTRCPTPIIAHILSFLRPREVPKAACLDVAAFLLYEKQRYAKATALDREIVINRKGKIPAKAWIVERREVGNEVWLVFRIEIDGRIDSARRKIHRLKAHREYWMNGLIADHLRKMYL